MGWLSRWRRKGPTVIGVEMAAAVSAEDLHQQAGHRPSPLVGVEYDVTTGEYNLFHLVESATDALVSAAALGAQALRDQELVDYRDALTQRDLYTLLTFANRVAVRGLRGHTDELRAGWAAVALLDTERVDWRDAAVAVGLLAYSATRTGTDLRSLLNSALAVAEPGMNKILRQYARSGEDGSSIGGYREVPTAQGPGLVQDGQPYDPTLDLISLAEEVARAVQSQGYRVTDTTTGTDIAPAWLPSADTHAIEQTRKRIRACVSLSACPKSAAPSAWPEQMLLAYVAESATSEDAALLVRAAEQPATSDIAALALSRGRMCLLLIARSTVNGVPSIESTTSLHERFKGPLTRTLSHQVTDG